MRQVPSQLDDMKFNELGIKGLQNRLNLHGILTPPERTQYLSRFGSSYIAWFASGLHKDGRHSQPTIGFHPLYEGTRLENPDENTKRERGKLKKATTDLLFDMAALNDRAFGSLTFILNIPEFQAECHGAQEVLADRIHANVYLPRHYVDTFPETHYPIASSVQTLIEGVGVPYVRSVKASYRSLNWDYGLDVHSTAGREDLVATRPWIPHPVRNSTRFIFWGDRSGIGAGADAVNHTTDVLILEDQIAQLENQLAGSQDQVSALQAQLSASQQENADQTDELEKLRHELAFARAYPVPMSSHVEDRLESSFKSLDIQTSVSGASTKRRAVQPNNLSRNIAATASQASLSPSPSKAARLAGLVLPSLAMSLASASSRSGSTSTQSLDNGLPVTGFGLHTIDAIRSLHTDLDNSVHTKLKVIAENYAEEQWEDALSLEDGIGFSNSRSVAEAMRADRRRQAKTRLY